MNTAEKPEFYRPQFRHDVEFSARISKVRSQYTLPYGPLVYGLVHAINPSFIIETGTCQGYLTAWIAKACIEVGYRKFITVDYYNEQYPHAFPNGMDTVKNNLKNCGVFDGVTEFVVSDALDYFKYTQDRGELNNLGMVVLDDHPGYIHLMQEINIAWNNLIPGGLLIVNDVGVNAQQAAYDFINSRGVSRKLWFFANSGMAVFQKDW